MGTEAAQPPLLGTVSSSWSPVHSSYRGAGHQGLGVCSGKRGLAPNGTQSVALLEVQGQGQQSGPRAVGLRVVPSALGCAALAKSFLPSELQFVTVLTSEECFLTVIEGLAFHAFIQKYSLSAYNVLRHCSGYWGDSSGQSPSVLPFTL